MSLKEVVSQRSPLGVCHPRDGLAQPKLGKTAAIFLHDLMGISEPRHVGSCPSSDSLCGRE